MSLRKVNALQTEAQVRRWARRVDMLGLCVGATPPGVPFEQAKAMVAAAPEVSWAVSLPDWRESPEGAVDALLRDLGASHFEFVPVDPAQPAFATELARLERITSPKVAGGFFLLTDDLSFLEDLAPYRALQHAGVAWFQFELDADRAFSTSQAERIEAFCASVPVLVRAGVAPPVPSARGAFIDLAGPGIDGGWPERQVLRWLGG